MATSGQHASAPVGAVKAVPVKHADDDLHHPAASQRTSEPFVCSRGPLLGNNLSIIGMQFADTVMAGQLGARDLAALAVGVGLLPSVPVDRSRRC